MPKNLLTMKNGQHLFKLPGTGLRKTFWNKIFVLGVRTSAHSVMFPSCKLQQAAKRSGTLCSGGSSCIVRIHPGVQQLKADTKALVTLVKFHRTSEAFKRLRGRSSATQNNIVLVIVIPKSDILFLKRQQPKELHGRWKKLSRDPRWRWTGQLRLIGAFRVLLSICFFSFSPAKRDNKSLGKTGCGGQKAVFDPMTKLPAFLSVRAELKVWFFCWDVSRTVLVSMLFSFIWQLHA